MKRIFSLIGLSILCLPMLAVLAQEAGQGELPDGQAMEQMQTRMQAMQEQMAQIRGADDPEERQRLMREYMQSMQEGMMMMGEMMRGSGGQAGQCASGDTECRMGELQAQQHMMGQQMGMMQMMMQHMMQGMNAHMMQDRSEE